MRKLLSISIVLLLSTSLYAQEDPNIILFHGFPWGTSVQDFNTRVGEPVHVEEFNGLQSLVYENILLSGYTAYMIAYFSRNGLEGGTYYFETANIEELMRCYTEVQAELLELYGPTLLYEVLLREMRIYETSWNLADGYIYLKINTRWWDEPVTLWFSSPELTRQLRGS
ncbi:MAG: hypothetical protein LBC80_08870 [Treponema sp.]|nr:hypothetical protein [Treponema sp.]